MARQSERIGKSGEYLVASVISLFSDTVTVMPHGSKADIVFEIDGNIYKCQVKTQSQIEIHRNNWRFDLRRGSHSKNRKYNKGDIDVYALVALEPQKIFFIKETTKSQITVDDELLRATNSHDNFKNLIKEL